MHSAKETSPERATTPSTSVPVASMARRSSETGKNAQPDEPMAPWARSTSPGSPGSPVGQVAMRAAPCVTGAAGSSYEKCAWSPAAVQPRASTRQARPAARCRLAPKTRRGVRHRVDGPGSTHDVSDTRLVATASRVASSNAGPQSGSPASDS